MSLFLSPFIFESLENLDNPIVSEKLMKKVLWILAFFALLIVMTFGGAIYFFTHRTEGRFFDSNDVQLHFTDETKGLWSGCCMTLR